MRRLILLLPLFVAATMSAQTLFDEMRQDPELFGDNYVAYRTPAGTLSEAPEGYKVCYMSHYGRHGSRYLIGKRTYERAFEVLSEADAKGMLTPLGCRLMQQLDTIRHDAYGHIEELTLRGAQQHRGIAHRMYQNFPELFGPNGKVDARSSVVIRCILSMANEVAELQGLSPELPISMDASQGDMYYICYEDKELKQQRKPKGSAADSAYTAFMHRHYSPTRLMNTLFTSEDYWKEHVKDARNFVMDYIWKVAVDVQSTELRHRMSLLDYFTPEELYNIWLIRNAGWYISHGPSPLNGGNQIFYQRNLIRDIVNKADSCLALIMEDGKTEKGAACTASRPLTASLRFGHEVVVIPTVCFLNLNGYGTQYQDLEELENAGWHDWRIFPMGSNIQIVFYSPLPASPKGTGAAASDKPILVKVLLNEEEATMPQLTPVMGPYYKWEDLRRYCMEKIEGYEQSRSQQENNE